MNDVVHVTPYSLICTNVSEKRGASCVKLENRDRLLQNIGIYLSNCKTSGRAVSVETHNAFVIIIIPFLHFTEIQLVLKIVRFSLTKHYLVTVLPQTI